MSGAPAAGRRPTASGLVVDTDEGQVRGKEIADRSRSDSFFVCSARRMANALHAHDVPSYLYRFNGTLDSLLFLDVSGRALHGAELGYLVGNPNPIGAIPAAYRGIASIMPGYWLRFAKAGAALGPLRPGEQRRVHVRQDDRHAAHGRGPV
jgi:carboxylesterase type B